MKKILLTTMACAMLLSSCTSTCDKPTNVIYLIGDGMGFGAVTSLLLTTDE